MSIAYSLSARWLVAFQSLVDCLRLGSGPVVPGAEGDGLWEPMGVGAPVSRSGLPGLCGEPNDSWRIVRF